MRGMRHATRNTLSRGNNSGLLPFLFSGFELLQEPVQHSFHRIKLFLESCMLDVVQEAKVAGEEEVTFKLCS